MLAAAMMAGAGGWGHAAVDHARRAHREARGHGIEFRSRESVPFSVESPCAPWLSVRVSRRERELSIVFKCSVASCVLVLRNAVSPESCD